MLAIFLELNSTAGTVSKFRKRKGKLLSCDLGLETERHHIASFDVGGDESLASQSSLCGSNVFGEGKIKADLLTRPELS